DIEWYAPARTKVAVGQTVAFSTSVIDQDLDETHVALSKSPASAKFDAITQTITWTAAKIDMPKPTFDLTITHPGRAKTSTKSFTIEAATGNPIPDPVAPPQTPVIETLLMIRQPGRLAQVNKDWPLDRLLAVGAETFKLQFPEDKRAKLKGSLDGATAY